jgi:hypothetical protein
MLDGTLQPERPKQSGITLGSRLYNRVGNLVSQKFVFSALYQQIAELCYPSKANILLMRYPGQMSDSKIFDGTALQSASRLASAIQEAVMNDSSQDFDLVTSDENLMAKESVRRWLDDTGKRMFSAMTESNMALQNYEATKDIVCFGSALQTIQENEENASVGFGGLIFQSYNVNEYVWACDSFGRVNEVYRQQKMNAQDMADRFGKDGLPRNVLEALERDPIDRMFRVIHAVVPKSDGDYFGTNQNMPYESIYFCVDSPEREVIYRSGFKDFPFLSPRWSKVNDEDYGRSPAMDGLPDIRTLNNIVELELRSLIKSVNPFFVTDDDGAIGSQFTIMPGGVLTVRPGARFEEVVRHQNFQPVNLKKVELQDMIRKWFFIDQLMLPPPQGSPMTKAELDRRVEQMYSLMGPQMGRLLAEWKRPQIQMIFKIMANARAFLPPPAELVNAYNEKKKAPIAIAFKGALARSQKMQDVVATTRWMNEVVGPSAQIFPDIIDNVDSDAMARLSAERFGVPYEIMRNPEDLRAMRQQKAKAMSDAQRNQMVNDKLQALGSAAPVIKSLQDAGMENQLAVS